MDKYFFDLVGQHCCQYDYQGRALAAPEQALTHAELLALECWFLLGWLAIFFVGFLVIWVAFDLSFRLNAFQQAQSNAKR